MRRSGYATAAVTTNPWVSKHSGFDTGFDRFVQLDTSRQGRLDSKSRRERLRWDIEAVRGKADDGAAAAAATISTWVDEDPPAPFFWFVNLLETHSPYLPPRPYHAASPLERLRAAEEARRHLSQRAIWRSCVSDFDVPDAALSRMRRLYAGSVRYVDAWLDQTLTKLEQARLLEDTLVIVCSDHGENFGEGGLLAHIFSLDERLIRVPFVAAGPGAESFAGIRSLVELPKRLAAAVGIEEHPWRRGGVETEAVIAQWDPPAPPSDPRVQSLVAEWGLGQDAALRMGTTLTAAVDGRWKLVRRDDALELYDLSVDPLELDPLGSDDRTAEASAAAERLRGTLDGAAANADPATAVLSREAPDQVSDEELGELEDRMRLLGYM
jgi:arylsulfatase A-like enzyme